MGPEFITESWSRLDVIAIDKNNLFNTFRKELELLHRRNNAELLRQVEQANALLADILAKLRYPTNVMPLSAKRARPAETMAASPISARADIQYPPDPLVASWSYHYCRHLEQRAQLSSKCQMSH